MARPRFKKLDAEKQERILMAAAAEFAQKGFESASFNQIIEAAEISKGAAYYYFDDKTDLYTTAVEYALSKLAEFFGDFALERLTAEDFWDSLEDYALKSMQRAQQHPRLTQLLMTVFTGAQRHPETPTSQVVLTAARNWSEQFILKGQELGAIREDIPLELLNEMFMGLGTAADTWIFNHVDEMSEEDMTRYSKLMTDVYRRVCTP